MDDIITIFEFVGDFSQSIQLFERDIVWQVIKGRQLVKRDIESIDMRIGQTCCYLESPSSYYTHQISNQLRAVMAALSALPCTCRHVGNL